MARRQRRGTRGYFFRLRFVGEVTQGLASDEGSAVSDGDGSAGKGTPGNGFLQNEECAGEEFVLVLEGVGQRG
jgi:hypothetical protein